MVIFINHIDYQLVNSIDSCFLGYIFLMFTPSFLALFTVYPVPLDSPFHHATSTSAPSMSMSLRCRNIAGW